MRHNASLAAIAAASVVIGCAASEPPKPTSAEQTDAATQRRYMPPGATAPLFNDLGDYHYTITTSVPMAQRYFDQGLILTYGFNHAEAARSFKEAQRLDPNCALCYWGESYVLGPNINKPMDPADGPRAWSALQEALGVAGGASKKEQDLILALANRYSSDPQADRAFLDTAYANAMRLVARDHPGDIDIKTMFAEALMDTMPWDYYGTDGKPKEATLEVIKALEEAMERAPSHAGATHLYIHAVEARWPQRAEAAADRLRGTVPGAGHLVHMPSHIYIRVGRYHDASEVNMEAAEADESYISQCLAQGFYPALYYPHNVHFLWSASSFEGRSDLALKTAKKIVGFLPAENVREFPFLEELMPIELLTLARFGRWDEILAHPAFDPDFRYATAVWHYSRGTAMAAKGSISNAELELARLNAIATTQEMHDLALVSIGSTGADLLAVASAVLEGEIASVKGHHDSAIQALRHAAELEDGLTYTEPPPWYLPVRDALGHVLLQAGRPTDAERAYREQLELTPRSGWTLFGLAATLREQGKTTDAEVVDKQFKQAWQYADVQLAASVF